MQITAITAQLCSKTVSKLLTLVYIHLSNEKNIRWCLAQTRENYCTDEHIKQVQHAYLAVKSPIYALDPSYIYVLPQSIKQCIATNRTTAISFTHRYNLFHILPGTENPLSISMSLPESVSTVSFNAFSFCRRISSLCSFLLNAHTQTHMHVYYPVSMQ